MSEKKLVFKKEWLKDQRIILALVIILLIIIVGLINPKFVRLANIMAILQQISVLGVMTMTMTMLLISGGIDLSIGSMMTLSGVVVGTVIMKGGSLIVAVLAGIGVSTLCGLVNGLIIAKSKCLPLIITLGTSQVFYGISLLIAGGSFINFQGKLDFLRKIQLFGFLPLMVILMLFIVILMYFLLNKTRYGRRIFAIGGNEKNAYLSGISVDAYKIISYGIGGATIGVAGLIFAARLNAITAGAGSGYELDALVASVIGGVTFEGGRGTILGAFFGCLLIGIISNAMDILGVHAYIKIVVTGAIIVGAVVLSNIENVRKSKGA